MNPITTLYVAGPMTGLPGYNKPAFHTAAGSLRAAGYIVRNPADHQPPVLDTWEDWMRLAIAALLQSQAVATLPGWAESRGACLEVSIAMQLRMPVLPVQDWLAHTAKACA